jgi:hypothetical protein
VGIDRKWCVMVVGEKPKWWGKVGGDKSQLSGQVWNIPCEEEQVRIFSQVLDRRGGYTLSDKKSWEHIFPGGGGYGPCVFILRGDSLQCSFRPDVGQDASK